MVGNLQNISMEHLINILQLMCNLSLVLWSRVTYFKQFIKCNYLYASFKSLRVLAVSTAMCFLCRRSDPAWRSFARTLRLAFPRALVPQLPWRDFRNQLNKKKRHSINSSPAVLSSPGLLNGSSPKHLSRVWLFMVPHLNDGDTGVVLNRSLRSVKRV